jgi:transcription termination factor NusB
MPIKACADKLKRELEENNGAPPIFNDEEYVNGVGETVLEEKNELDELMRDKAKSKKVFLAIISMLYIIVSIFWLNLV